MLDNNSCRDKGNQEGETRRGLTLPFDSDRRVLPDGGARSELVVQVAPATRPLLQEQRSPEASRRSGRQNQVR